VLDGELVTLLDGKPSFGRRTALLIHLQKRTMRPPQPGVLAADRYWIRPNGFSLQTRVTPWAVRAARLPAGPELLPFYLPRPSATCAAVRFAKPPLRVAPRPGLGRHDERERQRPCPGADPCFRSPSCRSPNRQPRSTVERQTTRWLLAAPRPPLLRL
jgi:hypothetical protein